MTFLVTWRMHTGKLQETLATFSAMPKEQEEASRGDVEILGRWHDLVGGTGCMVANAPSTEAIAKYALHWNGFMDLEIVPVVDDDGARAVGQQMAKQK